MRLYGDLPQAYLHDGLWRDVKTDGTDNICRWTLHKNVKPPLPDGL